jgi:predicted nucleotidyltransferase
MQALGLVVEYNPFHNGHAYHVLQSKKETGADVVIAVMSGNFLQRGEPAIVDKWHRTQMALHGGVDLVIELPYVYSTAQAQQFAFGAIYLLEAMGCQQFAFGSESGKLEPFLNTYHIIHDKQSDYNTQIQTAIKQGVSYPMALQHAYSSLIPETERHLYIDLAQPNNILGFHYIEAAQSMNANIQPYTIERIEANYHDDIDYNKKIASATGIRKAMFQNQLYDEFLPTSSADILQQWQQQYDQFVQWEAFWPLLQYAILRQTPDQLTAFADVKEGLQFALLKHAANSSSYAEFIQNLKSKRYTWTRLQRMLTHIFTGITKQQLHQFEHPQYIRLLGMTENGQRYISANKKHISLPLISRVGKADNPMLQLDVHAANMYRLGMGQFTHKKISEDYQSPPIRVTF